VRSHHHDIGWLAVEVSQLRQTTYEIGRDMELPSYYGFIHEKIRSRLDRMGLGTRIGTLAQNTVLESPHVITAARAQTPSFKVRASSLLKQGRIFIDIGLEAEDEIKPLLLYYGIAQTWGFFVQSCIGYPGRSTSHGLSVMHDGQTFHLKILEKGSYVRLINSFAIFGAESPYSKIRWDSSQSKLVLSTSPTKYPIDLKIEDWYNMFVKHWKEDSSSQGEIVLDQDCYMLLFVASHLARYRPETWTETVRGESSESWMRLYRRAFERCQFMFEKAVLAVHYISEGVSPRNALWYPAWSQERGPQPVSQDNGL
jgi:hypothetical protein